MKTRCCFLDCKKSRKVQVENRLWYVSEMYQTSVVDFNRPNSGLVWRDEPLLGVGFGQGDVRVASVPWTLYRGGC